MKSETLSEKSERINVELVAEEYRRKGYRVTREPRLDFLPGFIPDLVVERNGEKKVIEVKSRSSMLGNNSIVEMAKLVYSQPGWSFDLHMIGEPEAMETPASAKSFDADDILSRLVDAERVRQSGSAETAFLLAWVACEAAIRALSVMHGIDNERITTATHLLDQATYHGVISRDDYFHLLDAAAFRNAFVHGYKVEGFNPELVTDLISATRNILDEIDRSSINDQDDYALDFWPSRGSTTDSGTPTPLTN